MAITIRRYRYRNFQIEHQVVLSQQPGGIDETDRFTVSRPDGTPLSTTPTLFQASQLIDRCIQANPMASVAA